MNKKERKANQALKDAADYISRIKVTKQEVVSKPIVEIPKPVVETPKPKEKPTYNGERIDSAEIKKLKKGHFFVVVTCSGQCKEVNKRFKSVTKAQEWISKYI